MKNKSAILILSILLFFLVQSLVFADIGPGPSPPNPSTFAPIIRGFFIALILTLILELIVALIYVSIRKISKKVLISVFIANIISLPIVWLIVWFIFPLINIGILALLLGEAFAFVFEGYFIYLLNKDVLTLKESFVLSILMNSVSLIIGGLIFPLVSEMIYPYSEMIYTYLFR